MDIQSKAILMALTVKGPTGNKRDKEATDLVASEFEASATSAGRYSKSLYGDALREYGKVRGRVKEWFYSVTLPWGEDGIRILPSSKILAVREKCREFEAELDRETGKILERLDSIMDESRTRLGKMFKESDFPTREQLREKFGLEVRYYPLPEAGDFRVNLSAEEVTALKDSLTDQLKDVQKSAIGDLWKRLHARVAKLAEICGRENGTVRDDFLARTIDLCSSLKDLNLWQDPDLSRMVAEVEAKVSGYTEAALAEPAVKATLASQVDTLMNSMAGFMGGGSNMGFIQAPKGWSSVGTSCPDSPKPAAAAPGPDMSKYSCHIKDGVVTYQRWS